MKEINTYIIEKLRINSNTKIVKEVDKVPSEEDFFTLLSKSGEVDMADVFGEDPLPYDEKNRDILSIYFDGDTPLYSFYSKEQGFDCESELTLDMLEDEWIIKIYNYMLQNYNANA